MVKLVRKLLKVYISITAVPDRGRKPPGADSGAVGLRSFQLRLCPLQKNHDNQPSLSRVPHTPIDSRGPSTLHNTALDHSLLVLYLSKTSSMP